MTKTRKRMRRITVNGEVHHWRLECGYREIAPLQYETLYRLIIYRDGFVRSPAIIHFTTWEDPACGGPLHTGAPLDLGAPDGVRVNLNRPAAVAEIIRHLLGTDWHPQSDGGRLEIHDGRPLLLKLFETRPPPD